MGGTHIFFVMPAKAGAGGNQLCAGGPRGPRMRRGGGDVEGKPGYYLYGAHH
jgi:hypothetical protein